MTTALLIVAATVLLAALWAILTYNALVRRRTIVDEAWSGIDAQLIAASADWALVAPLIGGMTPASASDFAGGVFPSGTVSFGIGDAQPRVGERGRHSALGCEARATPVSMGVDRRASGMKLPATSIRSGHNMQKFGMLCSTDTEEASP